MADRKPTREEILAAGNEKVADVIAEKLRVLFCGINPGLYTAAVGHHFARPGNRFWPTLYAAGFTERLLLQSQERELLKGGYGITNVVERATATAEELSVAELLAGGRQLKAKVMSYQPAILAVLGIAAYRTAFQQRQATLGRQMERIGDSLVWVLPNPSGLNAHYQLDQLAHMFRELRLFATASPKK
ncbi:MAG: G/U mismatch-specific DNA glycosylase [Pyrinomonadaceae bacterium]